VATSEFERQRLKELHRRGDANGLSGLRWLEGDVLREIEPHAAGIAALHVPEEGIVDYGGVCQRLRSLIVARGGEVLTAARVVGLTPDAQGWRVRMHHDGAAVREEHVSLLVNCAGLHVDRVARMAGENVSERIVPFRGEYWLLKPERSGLVRTLIYPVPNPAFPFLGVHLTRTVHGHVEAGPNAVLALAREGYGWGNVNVRDLAEAVAFPGLWRFVARYPRVATYEVARSLSRALFVRSLQRLVPALTADDLTRGPSGVRAQLLTRRGDLVHDFRIVRSQRAVHVLSAPSPAATASLAIGGEVATLVRDGLGIGT
jgi:L-2-hydroxyglutarate oxidase